MSRRTHETAGPSQGLIPECAARRYSNETAGPSQGLIPECAARRYSNRQTAGPSQGRIPERATREGSPMSESGQFRLLAERRFGPFFVTQFLGAFNDNVFKNALVILITFHGAGLAGLAPEVMVNLAGGAVHPAVLPVLGHRRAARRQVRQGAPHPPGQAARDRDHGDRGGGLRPAQPRAAAGGALPARACTRRCSARSSTRSCRRVCARASWWAATRWSRPAPSLRSSSARSSAVCSSRAPPGRTVLVPAMHDRRRGARLRGEPVRSACAARRRRTSRSNWNPFTETWRNLRVRCAATARCSYRSSASPGSGSSAR